MSVYITKLRSNQAISYGLLFGGKALSIKVYKGTMGLSTLEYGLLTGSKSGDLLCDYGPFDLAFNATTKLWSLLTTCPAATAVGTGSPTWFIIRPAALSANAKIDYALCDSIALSGNVGVLQLNSLSFTSGVAAPLLTDFAVSLA